MQSAANSQTGRRWWHVAEALLWVAFFAVATVLIGLRYWILPNVERYRPEIVAALSQALGLPVDIGAIEAGWNGLYPRLDIGQMRIRDREGREALVLPSVEGELSWRALLRGRFGLHSFTIEGPQLVVRRSAEGEFFVAGLRIEQDSGNGAFADWLLSQREIVIRDATVVWQDDMRGAPPLELRRLDFRLRNSGENHRLGLSAQPPASLGAALDLRAEVTGRTINELKEWNGRFFAELGSTNLAAWRAWVDYPLEVREGHGALRLWMTLAQGQLRLATADLQLNRVAARLKPDLPMLELASIHGRLQGRNLPGQVELSARDLEITLTDGARLLPTSFRFVQSLPGGNAEVAGRFQATRLDLSPLARVAVALPFPAVLRDRLAELEPRGELQGLDLTWRGELPQARNYAGKSSFAGLGMNAWRAIPGFTGLTGQVDANEKSGILKLTSSGAQILLPRIFPDPALRLDTLVGRIDWELREGTHFGVRVRNLEVANEHLAGSATGAYDYAGSGPGTMDLTAHFNRADARFASRYLPLGSIMGDKTREFLAAGIVSGRSTDARVRVKGDLRDFPFAEQRKGIFEVVARVTNGVFNYGANWPRIEGIDAELRFERQSMRIAGRSGTIYGTRLTNVRLEIPDMRNEAHLLVDGQAEGPSSDFLRYVASSPVRSMIDGVTETFGATGRGRLRLKLDLPLDHPDRTQVAGEYQFAGNTLTVHPQLPPVERVGGRIVFTDSSMSLQDIRGQFLGGPVAASGGTRGGETVVNVRGDATVAGLRALVDHPWRSQLNGGAPYTATISAARGGRLQVTVESSLRGLGSDLPPPLAKRSPDAMPLRVDLFPSDSGARDRISVALGNGLAAEFLRQREGDRLQLRRAGVALSGGTAAVRLPERSGVLVTGTLGQLDLDRWQAYLDGATDAGAGTASVDVKVGVLDVLGRRITGASIKAGADGEGWSANVSAEELAGDLSYRSAGRGKLTARLAHFRLPDAYPGAKTGSTKELPALDVVADRFTYRGKSLGRVELVAQNEAGNWNVEKLTSVSPESALSAKGRWRTAGTPGSDIEFSLDVNDLGKFMQRIGYKDTIAGGTATLTGNLHWAGDPTEIHYPTLSGKVNLEALNGQVLEIEPGIGKLLSLLKFDLSSTFNKGFGFARIDATADIDRGVASFKDFRMRGSSADIFMQGTAQLAQETQDLRIRVIPSLGDGVSSLSGFVWGPIVGMATLVAQRLLKNPLGEIFAVEYRVTGSWTDPKVERTGTSVARQEKPAESDSSRSANRK